MKDYAFPKRHCLFLLKKKKSRIKVYINFEDYNFSKDNSFFLWKESSICVMVMMFVLHKSL